MMGFAIGGKPYKPRKPRDHKIKLILDNLPYSFVFSVSSETHFPAKASAYRKLGEWCIKAAEYIEWKNRKKNDPTERT